MSHPPKEALRRGWCPGTLKPMETGDGWLVRLHPPGARLTSAQLRRIAALAADHGNGLIEISARANLQLRGVTAASHPKLVASLLAEHLVDEHEGEGPQRLTLLSPLASPPRHDGGAPIDTILLAERIERAARTIPGLPAKFGIVVDDCRLQSLDGFTGDIRLFGTDAGRVILCLADRLWRGPLDESEAAPAVEAILRGFSALRRDAPERIRRLRDLPPDALAGLTTLPEASAPAPRPPPRRAGLFALEGNRFAALIGLPFGRCDAATLDRLGAHAEAGAEVRFSPWRGLAFRDLGLAQAERLLALAGELGLVTRDDEPRLSVQACTGSPACSRAETPAMADAAALAGAAADLIARGATFHVSGCVKACAHPAAADLTLVGRAGRYDVVCGGTARDEPIATLDLSAIVARLQPGHEFYARLTEAAHPTESRA
ncbi:precorrin-3B synthase [Bosea sp. (in: a-proteobacteria)]|uniref:precorrin-3B synthase n=1 Tax=Bosea sp. (in: a-proteobacteria) TaxID=1871050 RepID=UPI00262160C5|nr:precorrin-3B synthase [Bosea sp. (in: a-proteobacteria)]MCO5090635.1 precorrin-3B synthase [Bosea sp. (in: a-proteobacteria)]